MSKSVGIKNYSSSTRRSGPSWYRRWALRRFYCFALGRKRLLPSQIRSRRGICSGIVIGALSAVGKPRCGQHPASGSGWLFACRLARVQVASRNHGAGTATSCSSHARDPAIATSHDDHPHEERGRVEREGRQALKAGARQLSAGAERAKDRGDKAATKHCTRAKLDQLDQSFVSWHQGGLDLSWGMEEHERRRGGRQLNGHRGTQDPPSHTPLVGREARHRARR